MAEDRYRPEPITPPTATSVPPAREPVDPWPESPYPAYLAGPAPAPEPVAVARRRRARWLIPVAASTAVLAVITFVVALGWPASSGADPDRPIAYTPFADAHQIQFLERIANAYTRVVDDRVYLAVQQGDQWELRAVALADGAELWRRRLTDNERWSGMLASTGAVVLYGYEYGDPRPLVVLDGDTGEPRWRRDTHRDDQLFLGQDVVALADHGASRLRGLELATGRQVWEIPFPRGEYRSAEVTVVQVSTDQDIASASATTGSYLARQGPGQLIMIGSDRSARLIDIDSGEVRWQRANVAGPRDRVTAHGDQLFVAHDQDGFHVSGYDLTAPDAQPRTVYTAPAPGRRPFTLRACGADRLCLLEQDRADRDSRQVVAVDLTQAAVLWRHDAPQAGRLLPVGDWLVVTGGSPGVVGYDLTSGEERLSRPGVAARLNGGNLLVFSTELNNYRTDVSVAGVAVTTGELTELGLRTGVLASACSWGGGYLACPVSDRIDVWRFVEDSPR